MHIFSQAAHDKSLVLHTSSLVTQDKSQIHVFFLRVRVKSLIMLMTVAMTVGMFSGYIRDTSTGLASSCPLLLDGEMPLMELNTLKIIPVGHLPPNHLLPHLCRWHTRWGVSQKGAAVALRSGIVSLTRISCCISSPGLGFGSHCQHEVYCNTRFTPLYVWRVQICVSLCLCVFVFVHWVCFVFFPVS